MLETFRTTDIVENHKTITANDIQYEISYARDELLLNWKNNGRMPRSFEPEFDRVCYVTLGKFRDKAPLAYLNVKDQLDSLTTLNLQTTVGERLNAELSVWEYDIREGGLYAQGTGERALEMFKRGRNLKRKIGNEVDFAREDAELVGMYKIEQDILESIKPNILTGRPELGIEEGTMWISISPRGDVENESSYPHNFYDIHTVKIRNGTKYIESKRFASALDMGESYLNTLRFHDYPVNFMPTAEYFLSHPIRIQGQRGILDADALHKMLHKRIGKTLNSTQMHYILTRIKPAIDEYIAGLSDNPEDREGQLARLRGVLNSADATAEAIQINQPEEKHSLIELAPLTAYELNQYRADSVREVAAGCGFSGGYGGVNNSIFEQKSAFSVSDYGKDKYGERTFNCPSCKKENVRPYNALLPRCQHCKSTEVAC